MPLMDVYIPDGALSTRAESVLLAKLTDLLIEHEGVDPGNETVRHMSWIWVHRPQVYVAGAAPRSPRYRFICQVPEGLYNDERRATMTEAIHQAVAEAEGGAWPRPESRVVIFTCEVPDGWWGGAGRVLDLSAIFALIWPLHAGMEGEPHELAEQVLAERRRQRAEELLAATGKQSAARAAR